MPDACGFRQVDEKHVANEVVQMSWSPRMDLIAVANVQGEVILQRLSWQRVWLLPPPGEDDQVTQLAWRPDGKVLGVSYACGRVSLVDVEDSSLLHSITVKPGSPCITSMSWVAHIAPPVRGSSSADDMTAERCYNDDAENYLPKLPPFTKAYSAVSKGKEGEDPVEDSKKLAEQEDLNLLIIGTSDARVLIYAYGVFPVAIMDLSPQTNGKKGHVIAGVISQDLYLLTVLLSVEEEDGTKNAMLVSFDTTLLAARHKEIRLLALKFGQLLTLVSYIDSSIQQMTEALEDILLQMDSKLTKFAEDKQKMGTGSVCNDFLRLLLFGIASDELQTFLLHELTDKGLKKLGHSIETSYSNIQKLVLKHLQSVGSALIYHLSDIWGMSLWYDKFGVLGLDTASVQTAQKTAGAFVMKACELQQVIDNNMKNFKAFFRWMYVVIQRLSDEPIPAELNKMTQQDINFVAQFLKENFTEETESNASGFKLEKVGQYLVNQDLVDPPDSSENPWTTFLRENNRIQESPLLYKSEPDKSLAQMYEKLSASVNAVLDGCAIVIGTSLQCVTTTPLFVSPPAGPTDAIRVSQMSKIHDTGKSYVYTAFLADTIPCQKCYVIRQLSSTNRSLEVMCIEVGDIPSSAEQKDNEPTTSGRQYFRDVWFYDCDTLSFLLEEVPEPTTEEEENPGDAPRRTPGGAPMLAQLNLLPLSEEFVPVPSMGHIRENDEIPCFPIGSHIASRKLENMRAAWFAVSGTRRVACVLFSSRRRVRLFLMDAEDEDEEEDEDDDDEDVEEAKGDQNNASLDQTGSPSRDTTRALPDVEDSEENKENTSRESSGMDI